jgi:hypothetical protein
MSVPENTCDGLVVCSACGEVLVCDSNGDMPDICPNCNDKIEWSQWQDPCEEVGE